MSPSVDDLEQDVVASRARLDQTLDRIQDRFSGAGSVSGMIGTARRALAPNDVYNTVLSSARRDPLPFLLIGVGVGWLVYKAVSSGRQPASRARPILRPHDPEVRVEMAEGANRATYARGNLSTLPKG